MNGSLKSVKTGYAASGDGTTRYLGISLAEFCDWMTLRIVWRVITFLLVTVAIVIAATGWYLYGKETSLTENLKIHMKDAIGHALEEYKTTLLKNVSDEVKTNEIKDMAAKIYEASVAEAERIASENIERDLPKLMVDRVLSEAVARYIDSNKDRVSEARNKLIDIYLDSDAYLAGPKGRDNIEYIIISNISLSSESLNKKNEESKSKYPREFKYTRECRSKAGGIHAVKMNSREMNGRRPDDVIREYQDLSSKFKNMKFLVVKNGIFTCPI
ncbi:MAG: hypothetical protein GC191_01760 [Azospirillum sp.]|nr:hypothetical protein [Azospirillum sp.]